MINIKLVNGSLNKEIEKKKEEMIEMVNNSDGVIIIFKKGNERHFYDFGYSGDEIIAAIETVKHSVLSGYCYGD